MDKNTLKQRFAPSHLLNFFLVCAFPFHLWIIIMIIRDSGWIIQRSGTDSFYGVASLAMAYALVESVLFFLLLLILSLLIPWKWSVKRVFTLSGFIALWIPIWDMVTQVYRAIDVENPGFLAGWLISTGHPIRYGYPLFGIIVLAMAGLTAVGIWLTSFNQKFREGVQNLLERIAILSAIYLVLDLAGIVIIVSRFAGR
jgi:hypothetical protein